MTPAEHITRTGWPRDPRWLDAPVSREAIRRALVAERRAQLATLSDDALLRMAVRYALPERDRAEMIHAIAQHEVARDLTVRNLTEDLPNECPTCERALRPGAVCRCGYDDRPATEMELAFVRAVSACDCGAPFGSLHTCTALPGCDGPEMMPTEEMAE